MNYSILELWLQFHYQWTFISLKYSLKIQIEFSIKRKFRYFKNVRSQISTKNEMGEDENPMNIVETKYPLGVYSLFILFFRSYAKF